MRQLAWVVICAIGLGACANRYAVFRNHTVGITTQSAQIVTVDAKQRNTYMAPVPVEITEGGVRKPAKAWAVCAEASPDAFTALSTSASADLAASGLGAGGNPDLRARAAIAISEAAGTIERTQTINLLRESMYRTCERYLGGAIDRDEFVVQAARDQRAMVAILAIEQLTRSVWPRSTVLNSGAASASVQGGLDYAAELKKAAEASATADVAKKKAAAGYDGATCDPILPPKADTPPDGTDAKVLADCKKSRSAVDKTAADAAGAAAYLDALKTSPAAASAFNLGASAGTGGSSTQVAVSVDKPSMTEVAHTVENIVGMAYAFDEGEMVCVVKLRNSGFGDDKVFHDNCVELLKAKVKLSTMQANMELQQLGALHIEGRAAQRAGDLETVMDCWRSNGAAFRAEAAKAFPAGSPFLSAIAKDDADDVRDRLTLGMSNMGLALKAAQRACPAG